MPFLKARYVEGVLAALQAENSDLRQQLRAEREKWEGEREKLLDRILALSAPGALREVRRAPSPHPQEPMGPPGASRRQRLHFPGYTTDTRPPSPSTPPSAPAHAPHTLTDSQAAEAISKES